MNLEKLLKTSAESLAREQSKALREAISDHLRLIADQILDADKDADTKALLAESPAGDGNGTDVEYIYFGHLFPEESSRPLSGEYCLGHMMEKLEAIERVITKGN